MDFKAVVLQKFTGNIGCFGSFIAAPDMSTCWPDCKTGTENMQINTRTAAFMEKKLHYI